MARIYKGFTLIEIGVVITILAIIALAAAPRFADLTGTADEVCANKLLNSLKTSAMFYVADEHKNPQVFNDFVILEGKVTGNKTLTLDNVKQQVKTITLNDNSKTLEVEFLKGGTATYHLDGCDVTAEINM
ncbi:MAG: prepilin-type N-terminal cleavage/methylation domain-containing protein [Cyanobacteriota bacterium]